MWKGVHVGTAAEYVHIQRKGDNTAFNHVVNLDSSQPQTSTPHHVRYVVREHVGDGDVTDGIRECHQNSGADDGSTRVPQYGGDCTHNVSMVNEWVGH